MSIKPPSLQKGDTIGIFAPSSWVEEDDINKSVKTLEKHGYKVFVHPQTYERENQSAGTNMQKALAFQGLWMRKDIKAIWAAGGGNRCMHFLDTLKFEPIKRHAKILIGFSDVTALLNAVYAHSDTITIHGPVFKNAHKYNELDHLLSILGGNKEQYPFNRDNILKDGKAEGKLVGGNLSLFQYLPETLPNEFCKDSILFLEDCNEEISRIDRMLLHLKRLKVFEQINALVVGDCVNLTDTTRPYGYTLKDIISEHTEKYDIPVLYNMPFGHGKHLYSMPIGSPAVIDTHELTFKMTEPAVL
ncbi:MAG: S66 peptidase family protein [Alcanivorax sp.]